MKRSRLVCRTIIALLLCFAAQISAQNPPPAPDFDRELTRQINTALDTSALKAGFQGVFIESLRDNRVVYSRNPDNAFVPASNCKLLTSGAAIALLGPRFAYHTRVLRVGDVDKSGTLHGNLVLKGDGDPILTHDDLHQLAARIARAGVRQIAGKILYDSSRFDAVPLGAGWMWDDESDSDAAQISALDCDENVLTVEIAPGYRAGSPCRVTAFPIANYLTFRNHTTTGSEKNALNVVRERASNVVTLTGSLPVGANARLVHVTLEDPARFAAVVFSNALRNAGIALADAAPHPADSTPKNAVPIAEHVSVPLSALIARMNKPSDNLIAECLLKTIGAVQSGEGSSRAGAESARKWFRETGLNLDSVHQVDGSGLSRYNAVSPRNVVVLLKNLYQSKNRQDFIASLPIAAVDGTLKNRMHDTRAAGNCRAKTGTMQHVSSLSGYVTTRDGETLVFSILMNNHLAPPAPCRIAQDKIIALLAEFHRSERTKKAGFP